jgi:hypothetical protein
VAAGENRNSMSGSGQLFQRCARLQGPSCCSEKVMLSIYGYCLVARKALAEHSCLSPEERCLNQLLAFKLEPGTQHQAKPEKECA